MLVLSNVQKLYDGSDSSKSAIKSQVDVFIDNGRIVEVKPHQEAVRENHNIIDCSEYFVTPGLIDCHSHVTAIGLSERHWDQMNTQKGLLIVERVLFATLVDGGVTTARDVGGATHFMKRMVEEGVFIGPRLHVAICMLSTTGGHADFRSHDRCHETIPRLWPPGPGRPSNLVDGPWECRKRVREVAACGADLIKVCASPGVASPVDKLENQDFSAEELAAICDEANQRGLRVAAHAHSQKGIAMAIENGVSDIQHISFLDEPLMEKALVKNLTVTPTSWVIHRALKDELPPAVSEKVKKVAEVHSRATEIAAKGGLKILMGTDPVFADMHGKNYLELAYLVREGLSSLQAWYGATGLAAKELGIEDTGILKAGNRCDLLICKDDVIEDPSKFTEDTLLEVFKDGIAYRGGFPQVEPRTFRSQVREQLLSFAK